MQLLLLFLFIMAAIGLFTDQMSGRLYLIIAGITVLTTALYYGATRFMS
jgi:hypothetical protein